MPGAEKEQQFGKMRKKIRKNKSTIKSAAQILLKGKKALFTIIVKGKNAHSHLLLTINAGAVKPNKHERFDANN